RSEKPGQALRLFRGCRRYRLFGEKGRDLRPFGAQRRRKVNDVQDALRPIETDWRKLFCQPIRRAKNACRCKSANRLYGAEIFSLRSSHRSAKSRVLFRNLQPEK